jgi:hypothetical protein
VSRASLIALQRERMRGVCLIIEGCCTDSCTVDPTRSIVDNSRRPLGSPKLVIRAVLQRVDA